MEEQNIFLRQAMVATQRHSVVASDILADQTAFIFYWLCKD